MPVDFKTRVTQINDWPRPGIVTYDIATLLRDKALFQEIVDQLAEPYNGKKIDAVVGLEARGFVLASALAYKLGTGMVLIRKKGKLPPPTIVQEYSYEYASNVIEIQSNSLASGQNIILVDDILATCGTMAAAVKLVNRLGVNIIGISFVISMDFMAGSDRLRGQNIHSLIHF